MKFSSTLFLKLVVITISLLALILSVIALPLAVKLIGLQNEIWGYAHSPVLIGMYLSVLPFLCALFQAFKILKLIDSKQAFSNFTVHALSKIKLSGLAISVIYGLLLPFFFIMGDYDDAPGIILIGLILIFAAFIIAAFAALLQRILQEAILIKSENDLTI